MERQRILIQPANTLPAVHRGGLGARTPTPSVAKMLRSFMLGTRDGILSQAEVCHGDGGAQPPHRTLFVPSASPQSPKPQLVLTA